MLSLPYNDNHIIECTCDCDQCIGKSGKHLNCMTTGARYYSDKPALGVDYHACTHGQKWRFVDFVFCDNCNEPFHDIVAWWLDEDVMKYINLMSGLTKAEQEAHAQIYLCPDCCKKIKQFVRSEQYEEWAEDMQAQRRITDC